MAFWVDGALGNRAGKANQGWFDILTVGQPTLSGLFHFPLILPVVAAVTLNCLFMVLCFWKP